ncbi:molybdate ABC transporter substrate-binding protein [Paraglaciecola sp. 2405UD69-4]|uniref:molybdate ABC transporter substrate-binding protein n=1 Tax=Paraglaciecola sp. 2405UD69-4 TaxID=3391836 RepID=UPI0039C8FACF
MKCFFGLFLILSVISFKASGDSAHLAVAANFRQCMQELIRVLEQESDHSYVLSFGSSGKFYAQILNGAPYDVFFSADTKKPVEIDKVGYAVADSRFTYAIGHLVLMGKVKHNSVSAKDVLVKGDFNKIALANPRVAPYGLAALEVLEHLTLQQELKPKWVIAENIAQAYQFVNSGNAELGFVALSQVALQKPSEHSVWTIPAEWHTPIEQQAIVLKKAQNNLAALALVDFMQSEKGQTIISSFGYSLTMSPAV